MDNDAVIPAAETFVRAKLDGEPTGHDWWHVERVRNTANAIRQIEGGDALIIDLALLLHDVGDRKVIGADDDDYSIARGFLESQDVAPETVESIMAIIINMSFSKSFDQAEFERTLEFKIVQDADRIDALGAIGVARAFAFGGSRGRPLYDPDYQSEAITSSEAYKKAHGSTFHHFEEKLLLLTDLLNTDTARTIAAKRDAYMRGFLKQFLNEWQGRA